MSTNLLSIGKSGLLAAQVGLSVTGNNLANALTPGYSRQVVVQRDMASQNLGYGFVGNGTDVAQIKRYSDTFLNGQVNAAQSASSALDSFLKQVSQVDNMLGDPTVGLSPALQDFFNSVQNVSSNPSSAASRQSMLSSAQSLASRLQGMSARLSDVADGINTQIASNVGEINSYAAQIAQLNQSIASLGANPSQQPNELLDKRDQLVAELSKQLGVTVLQGDNNSISVTFGNGQSLVAGQQSYPLGVTTSPTDLGRVEVGFQNGNKITPLPESVLSGGELGGLMSARNSVLDQSQNALGRIAIALASTFNSQNALGLDQNGAPGAPMFVVPPAQVTSNVNNSVTSTTQLGAVVSDPTKLTTSDYKVGFDGTNFTVTRASDGVQTVINPYPQTVPQTIDGVDFSISGTAAAGDGFLVKPTVNGASGFAVALTDGAGIAAAAPILTNAPNGNTGKGKISAGSVDKNYLTPGNALAGPVTMTYNLATNSLSGFPAGQAVTVTANGVATVYPAGTANIPYTPGANIAFGGVNLAISGAPGDQDSFTVGPNVSGAGDNRNILLMSGLQTSNILDGKSTFQGGYAAMVSFVGNATRAAQINSRASNALLEQNQLQQQSVSGVNTDEEGANLLKYQQAYQASGKVMQIASTLFDTLLSLGH